MSSVPVLQVTSYHPLSLPQKLLKRPCLGNYFYNSQTLKYSSKLNVHVLMKICGPYKEKEALGF